MAQKGTNNSKRKSNTKKSQNTTRKSTSKKSTRSKAAEVEFEDPFFEDSSKEIVLWGSLVLCILLCISNFGIGGMVGNAVSNFLFGVFGIIQFVLPFMVVFSAFFIISKASSAKITL